MYQGSWQPYTDEKNLIRTKTWIQFQSNFAICKLHKKVKTYVFILSMVHQLFYYIICGILKKSGCFLYIVSTQDSFPTATSKLLILVTRTKSQVQGEGRGFSLSHVLPTFPCFLSFLIRMEVMTSKLKAYEPCKNKTPRNFRRVSKKHNMEQKNQSK